MPAACDVTFVLHACRPRFDELRGPKVPTGNMDDAAKLERRRMRTTTREINKDDEEEEEQE